MRSSAKSSTKRKRGGRPRAPQRRPVLAARVPEDFYERIRLSAVLNGRNASEEMLWRVQQSFEYEATRKSQLELLQRTQKMSAEELFRQLGYTKVYGVNGAAWFEPGVNAIQWIFANMDRETRVVLQEMLDQAATHAVEKMRTQS